MSIYIVILCAGFLTLGFGLGVRAAWWAARRRDGIETERMREHIRRWMEQHPQPAEPKDQLHA